MYYVCTYVYNMLIYNINICLIILLHIIQLLGAMSKTVSATDKSNAAKSMISKKNRYKDRFPCEWCTYVV